jgi:hypothetical protein
MVGTEVVGNEFSELGPIHVTLLVTVLPTLFINLPPTTTVSLVIM